MVTSTSSPKLRARSCRERQSDDVFAQVVLMVYANAVRFGEEGEACLEGEGGGLCGAN